MTAIVGRRMIALGLVCVGLLCLTASAQAAGPTLDLDTLSGAQAEKLMQEHKLTSVELTEAYLARIAAINKAGPASTRSPRSTRTRSRRRHRPTGTAPTGSTSARRWACRSCSRTSSTPRGCTPRPATGRCAHSFPAQDSGVAKELRAHGVVILGKLGLSEWANSFGSQPSGFSNLTGQVLNAIDTGQGPSGSSSGSAAAASAAWRR